MIILKKFFETIGCLSIIVFSFYFTNMVSLIVANKSTLMNDVKNVTSLYNVDAVDAKIINNDDNNFFINLFCWNL